MTALRPSHRSEQKEASRVRSIPDTVVHTTSHTAHGLFSVSIKQVGYAPLTGKKQDRRYETIRIHRLTECTLRTYSMNAVLPPARYAGAGEMIQTRFHIPTCSMSLIASESMGNARCVSDLRSCHARSRRKVMLETKRPLDNPAHRAQATPSGRSHSARSGSTRSRNADRRCAMHQPVFTDNIIARSQQGPGHPVRRVFKQRLDIVT